MRQPEPELFSEAPFNLAGESLNDEHDAQAEAEDKQARERAANEARKAQFVLTLPTCDCVGEHGEACPYLGPAPYC